METVLLLDTSTQAISLVFVTENIFFKKTKGKQNRGKKSKLNLSNSSLVLLDLLKKETSGVSKNQVSYEH